MCFVKYMRMHAVTQIFFDLCKRSTSAATVVSGLLSASNKLTGGKIKSAEDRIYIKIESMIEILYANIRRYLLKSKPFNIMDQLNELNVILLRLVKKIGNHDLEYYCNQSFFEIDMKSAAGAKLAVIEQDITALVK